MEKNEGELRNFYAFLTIYMQNKKKSKINNMRIEALLVLGSTYIHRHPSCI